MKKRATKQKCGEKRKYSKGGMVGSFMATIQSGMAAEPNSSFGVSENRKKRASIINFGVRRKSNESGLGENLAWFTRVR